MTDGRFGVSSDPSSRRDDAEVIVPRHPLSHRLRAWLLWLALMGLLAWSWAPSEMFRVSALFTDWRDMAEFGRAFLPPNFPHWDSYLEDLVITIQIAILGTPLAGFFGLPLSMLSSP